MSDCLFCKIIKGDIPSTKVYEDENTYAFLDITPQAPVHVLVVPKTHVQNATEAAQQPELFAACLSACVKVAKLKGIDQTGYRIVTNAGKDAQQSVFHLHFHVLGGESMSGQMA